VLVPLFREGGDLRAVFTRRREDLKRHAGEISFPGGRQDEPDEDLRSTALREAEEEIGLPVDDVELVGALPPVGTFVTGYRIFPFVGVIVAPAPAQGRPDQDAHVHGRGQPRVGRDRADRAVALGAAAAGALAAPRATSSP